VDLRNQEFHTKIQPFCKYDKNGKIYHLNIFKSPNRKPMKKTFLMLMLANLILFAFIGFFSLGAVLAQPEVKIIKYPEISVNFEPQEIQEEQGDLDEAPAENFQVLAEEFLPVDPFTHMFIDSLADRATSNGILEDMGAMNCESESFSRRQFRYPSEGMGMYGFINIPEGEGPFPVIILLHGHVKREGYNTLAYTSRYADALTEKGYIVIHPNLRGYLPTPDAENQLGVGDTVDILNLISIIRQQAGSEGLLKYADAENIGLWGHSMGGGIVMRVMVIDPAIKAGLLYASVHADERVNLAHFREDGRGYEKCQAPVDSIRQISPLDYLEQVNAPISIHHGDQDERVPYEWSNFLYERLNQLGENVTYEIYPDQLHTFRGSGDTQFIKNSIEFFDKYLKP
jgi:dienelactone hydrolase